MKTVEEFKAGTWRKGRGYQYFLPNTVNDTWAWRSPEVSNLLERSAVRLGELNSYARFVPDIHSFLKLHVTKEAVLSSRIEGTRTRIQEALLSKGDVNPEYRDDWVEVNNYIEALEQAIQELEKLPLSSRLLRKTHKILLSGVRGEHKLPGEFRQSQNWIGGAGLADAVFVPPQHQHIESLMADLEKLLHNHHVPSLIRIAIAHYQFETIHPFLDGNGRIGRLMITLFLVSEKILEAPLLYLSTYFEHNKGMYYDNLTFVRTKNDLVQWIKYFLVGIEEVARQSVNTLSKVVALKQKLELRIQGYFGRRAKSGHILLQFLFEHPVISVDQAQGACELSYKAANDLVEMMVQHHILEEITGRSRNRLFRLQEYVGLFE